MNESVKPRFAVDFDEIERQLAQAQATPAQPAATRNDPLAELARIVGQDDPFQSLLANDASARRRNQTAGLDDLFATHEGAAPASRSPQGYAGHGLRGGLEVPAFDHGQYTQAEPHGAAPDYGYQAAPQGQGAYQNAAYPQDYYDDGTAHHAAHDYDQPEDMGYQRLEKPRSRKGLLAVGAVLGAVVLGGGAAFLLNGNSVMISGEPPLIQASNEPVKVPPQNPGGVEIPNQNKQIYERAQSADTKVVSREEQPVDVQQAVRMNSGAADATGATSNQAPPPAGLNLGEPRKVRTVTIRPDGTVVNPEGATARPAPAIPAMALPAAAQPTQPAPNAGQAAQAQPKPAASTPVAETAAAAPKPAPAASTPASGASPQRVASAQPTAIAPPTAASEPTATGGFSVQLGVSASESQAQAALEQYQRKFSDLEGIPPLIRKAEVNGNTIYRVRVGPMSRDEASSLCSKLQGQGGQCFVAKN